MPKRKVIKAEPKKVEPKKAEPKKKAKQTNIAVEFNFGKGTKIALSKQIKASKLK